MPYILSVARRAEPGIALHALPRYGSFARAKSEAEAAWPAL
jgi:hypothetical protein